MSVIKKLIRFYKFDLDEKRRSLHKLEEQEAQIQAAIDATDRAVEEEQAFSRGENDYAPYYGGYASRVQLEREKLEDALAKANEVVETTRESVVQAFEELKKYEITKDRQEHRSYLESERQNQIALDEIALTMHQRKDK
ncbi:MAG: flagellar FliJ family protein [Pseudomonadota bacterium]|nr:flagellar FliJ family protein [Pseudomonadota bacterium]